MRRIFALTVLLATIVLLAGRLSAPVRAQQAPPKDSHAASPRAIVIASGAQLADIRGLAVDAAGNVFISSEISPAPAQCIARSVAAHVSVTVFSNCAAARVEDPSGIAVALSGTRVFLANRAQNSIRRLDMLTGKVTIEPEAKTRSEQGTNSSSTSQFTLAEPAGLATDAAGNLYIADRGNNRILRLTADGGDFVSVAQVLDAAAVATNVTGQEIFVASPASNRIFRIDAATSDIAAFAGTGALPESVSDSAAQFPSPVATRQIALAAPEGIAVDGAGNVFIADTGANAVLRVDAKTNLLTRVVLGSELSSPGALAIDRRGNLFVADRGNHRVVEFSGVAAPAAPGGLTLTPSPFDYGDQPTGGTTPQQPFVLTNNSSSALSLVTTDFSFAGNDPNDFMQTNNCVPQLAIGSSCQIFVTFGPQGTGARAGSLTVTNSDPSNPQTASASLAGTGDDFQLTAANLNAKTQTVVPGDPGNYSLSVTPDSVFGGMVTLTCPTVVHVGASLVLLQDVSLTCLTNPSQIAITPGQATPFAVKITTLSGKAPGAWLPASPPTGIGPGTTAFLAGFLACLLAFLISATRPGRREEMQFARSIPNLRRIRRAWAISALAFFGTVGAAGCYHPPAKYNPSTPPNIYTIDISGTAQNASRAITLTLNVE
ncbi:MAG TPA: choice-of-anchor D domain-containing protein [Candidatus Acidoferrales bacterium]|nr:choice-of-anchor D domain-containing protein [Candidatus Acidoferrales bacterium]